MGKITRSLNHVLMLVPVFIALAACHSKDAGEEDSRLNDSLFHSTRLKKITDSIRQYPDSAALYFERGGMLFTMKEFDLAGKDIQKAISLDPLKTDYYIALGEIQLAGNNYPPAQEAFSKAVRMDPDDLLARLQLSYSLFHNKNYKATIAQTDTIIKMDNRVAEAYGLQSQAYNALNDTTNALTLMEKAVSLAPENYDVLMAMGDLLMNQKDSGALQFYRRAKDADTTQAEPLFCMGLFYTALGDADKAVAAYRACIGRDAYYLDAYLKLGEIYQANNAWEKALKVYILATEIAPKSSDAFYGRGVCYEKLDQKGKALNDYENAYSLEKNNAEAEAAVKRMRAYLSTSKKH